MQSSIVTTLDRLAAWRGELDRRVAGLAQLLAENSLLDDSDAAALGALRERLASGRLVLAFVAEVSRGKSELINAIFFADAGRRVLPATPGRTTMCPVELYHEAGLPARLSLLPIETRLRGLALSELRRRDEPWQHVPLDPKDPDALARALSAVTRTQRVSVAEATQLGFWNAERPDDNPPLEEGGQVDVPAWRHALINYPHPLLQRGLVVIDTPGLNAIGAEPELTLSLLPSAHAVVFVLAADTGVTRSDLSIWRDHLGGSGALRYVVLNKIDALADPLASPGEVQAQIERQCELTAQTLGLQRASVFPLSARNGLAARLGGDERALAESRLPALEDALTAELLPRQHELLRQSSADTVQRLRQCAARRLADRRRQHAEQLLELRGLRGKSAAKVRLMLQRVDAEAVEFEHCTARLAAVRVVQLRLLREVRARLSSEVLRAEVATMQAAIGSRPFNIGARPAFAGLCERVQAALLEATGLSKEMRQMLEASFQQLNAEYGFALVLPPAPELQACSTELKLIDRNYSHYLGFMQSWRMVMPGFGEQFRRMLLSKLRVLFENAAAEVELWSKSATDQVELQLQERRRAFERRREALQRIQAAAGELETRIDEVQAQDDRLAQLRQQIDRVADEVLEAVHGEGAGSTQATAQPQRQAAA